MRSQFAAGHRNEGTRRTVNDLEVSDNETVVEGYAAESKQSIVRFTGEFYSDFGYPHVAIHFDPVIRPPLTYRFPSVSYRKIS